MPAAHNIANDDTCLLVFIIYASTPLGGANAYMFYSLFFSVRHNEVHKYETTVLGFS